MCGYRNMSTGWEKSRALLMLDLADTDIPFYHKN